MPLLPSVIVDIADAQRIRADLDRGADKVDGAEGDRSDVAVNVNFMPDQIGDIRIERGRAGKLATIGTVNNSCSAGPSGVKPSKPPASSIRPGVARLPDGLLT